MDSSGRDIVAGRDISGGHVVEEIKHARYGGPADEDELATGLEPHGRRPDVLGLAVTVGLVVFLLAESIPGGLSGAKAFFLGTGVVVALVAGLTVIAVVVDRRRPDAGKSPLEQLSAFAAPAAVGVDADELRSLAGQLALLYVDLPKDHAGRLGQLLRFWPLIDPESRQIRFMRLAEQAKEGRGVSAAILSRLDEVSPAQLAVLVELIEGGPNRDR